MNRERMEKVIQVIRESTETDQEITGDTALYEDLGLASGEVYVLLGDLEEAFHTSVPAAWLRRVRTVQDLCQVISEASGQ